jgi:protein-disulfide isomerase
MKHESTERHQTAQQTGNHRPRRALLRAGAAAAALLVTTACHDGSVQSEEAGIAAASESIRIYGGIPQDGIVLGDPRAPITITEFADLSCSHCRLYALETLPEIVNRHVRTGQVKLVFRNLAFLGSGSVRAARTAAALGLQDKLWQFVDVFFREQDREGVLRVDDALLRRLVATLPGVDVTRAMADRTSAAVDQQLADAKKEATRFGIRGTPAFLIGRTGEAPHVLEVSPRTPEAFSRAIAELQKPPRAAALRR